MPVPGTDNRHPPDPPAQNTQVAAPPRRGSGNADKKLSTGRTAAVELGKKAQHEERTDTELGKALAEQRAELQQQQQAIAQTRQGTSSHPPRKQEREVTKEPEIQYEMPNGRPLCPEFQHGKCATQGDDCQRGLHKCGGKLWGGGVCGMKNHCGQECRKAVKRGMQHEEPWWAGALEDKTIAVRIVRLFFLCAFCLVYAISCRRV